jgi:hypothetical protein
MRDFALFLVASLVSSHLDAQCACVATTTPTNPYVNISGPPAWAAGGTIEDAGAIAGVCDSPPQCVQPRPCENRLVVNIWVTFPYNPPNAAPLPYPSADIVVGHAKFGISWTGASDNGNGTGTLSAVFPAVLFPACATGNGEAGGTFEIEWTGPGGGSVVRSGSANVKCKGCG